MSAINRKDLRTALAAALVTSLTRAAQIERYLADPGKRAPLVTLGSRGSGGKGLSVSYNSFQHGFWIHFLVPTGKRDPGLATEGAEDLLDDVRQQFDGWIDEGTVYIGTTPYSVELDGQSEVVEIPIGGERFLDERIPVVVYAINS